MSDSDASNVLVLDANQRSALAVTRSLGKLPSVRVWTADCVQRSLAGSSRFSTEYLVCPSPEREPEEFLNWLSQVIARHGFTAVFPVTEISSQLLLMNRSCLGKCRLPFAAYESVMSLADKGRLLDAASKFGIPTPEYTIYQQAGEVDIANFDTFPVVLKPCLSKVWTGTRWISTDVSIVHNRDDLIKGVERMRKLPAPFMIQSFIPGHGAGIFALYSHGEAIASFAHRRIREKPPWGGVSVVSESVAADEELKAYAHTLLSAVGWHGVAMVEFRIGDDGIPYLMEINTRFWGSLQLAIDAGVDFPQLLWRICQGDEVVVNGYRTGQRLRWLLGDLDSLYLTLRDSRYGLRDKLSAIVNFVLPGNGRHEVNRWEDMGPALHEFKEYFGNLHRRPEPYRPTLANENVSADTLEKPLQKQARGMR